MPTALELVTLAQVAAYVNRPRFRGYAGTGQTLTAGADSLIEVNTITFDNAAAFDTSTFLYQCPAAGYWRVSGQVRANPTASGQTLGAKVYRNGAEQTEGLFSQTGGSGAWSSVVSDIFICNVGDTIGLYSYCSAALTTYIDQYDNYLTIEFLGSYA